MVVAGIQRGCAGSGPLYYLRLPFVFNVVVFSYKCIERVFELYGAQRERGTQDAATSIKIIMMLPSSRVANCIKRGCFFSWLRIIITPECSRGEGINWEVSEGEKR